VFHDVVAFAVEEIVATAIDDAFQIVDVEREATTLGDGSPTWQWYPAGFTFIAKGYTQYIRRPPILVRHQFLSDEKRGGLSFRKGRDEES